MKVLSSNRVWGGFVKVDQLEVEGLKFKLEVVRASDSVAFLVHDVDKNELLFCTQDRAPMISDGNPSGEITEVAAGRFDCDKGVVGLILHELQQELGVVGTEDQVTVINSGIPVALSPGVLTEKQYLAYVAIKTEQISTEKKLYGDKEEGESIARRFVSVDDVLAGKMEIHDMKTFALIQWFVANIQAPKYKVPIRELPPSA